MDFFLLKIHLEIRIIIILSLIVTVHLEKFVSLPEFPLCSMLKCICFLKSGNSFQKVSVFNQIIIIMSLGFPLLEEGFSLCLENLLGCCCDSSGRVPA
jgi:hypothetical protein